MNKLIPFPPIYKKSPFNKNAAGKAIVIQFPKTLTRRIADSQPLPRKRIGE